METIQPNAIRQIIEVGKRRALRQVAPGDLQGRVLETLRILEALSTGNREVTNEVARLANQLMMEVDMSSNDHNNEVLKVGIEFIREQIRSLSKKPCASKK
jgi:hypothetical protein